MNKTRITAHKLLFALGFVLLCALILAQFERSAAGPAEVEAGPKVYWSDKEDGRIWRANLDGSSVERLPGFFSRPEALTISVLQKEMYVVVDEYEIEKMDLNGGNRQVLVDGYNWLWYPNSLAVDHRGGALYWTDRNLGVIGRVNVDGSDIVYQLPPGPDEADGLVVDETQGKVYWLRYGRLYQSNLDGSDTKLFPELYSVTDMALDISGGKIYFAESGYGFYDYSIKRVNLDGSDVELLDSYEMGRCDGIALDLDAGKVYWSERGTTPRILRANLDGTESETVVDEKVFGPFGLAVDADAGKLYWVDWVSQKMQRANLDGSEVEDLLSTVPARPRHLVLDADAGKMFWTGEREAAVWQANLDGSDKQPLVGGGESSSTGGIDLHKAGGQLYWTDAASEAVTRAKVDGTAVEKIVFRRLEDPQGLALDEAAGKMYWVDRELDQISRANVDGMAVEVLVNDGLDTPTSLALDLLHGKMVWTEPFLQQINQANLDGSEVETLLAADAGLIRPNLVALDVSAGKMYWTDWGSRRLRRANLDGTDVEDLVTSGIVLPSGLSLMIPPLEVQRSYVPFVASGQ